ncbi:MAG: HAD-IA family hydrolase [Nanoarchaeota archaeon]|nr:HAD-IA family hydrolase [Nanoarchaeota archaeon]
MMKRFSDIKAIIWDLDGTLYDPSINLFSGARRTSLERLAELERISFEDAKTLYERTYLELGSNTRTFEKLGLGRAFGLPDRAAVIKITDEADRTSLLSKDDRLVEMFEDLRGYQHVLLTNSGRVGAMKTLDAIGLSENFFSKVLTADDFSESKPSPITFLTALDFLGECFHDALNVRDVLSVGDRDRVDIIPAAKLGLRTVKVWTEKKTGVADVELSKVYDLADYL